MRLSNLRVSKIFIPVSWRVSPQIRAPRLGHPHFFHNNLRVSKIFRYSSFVGVQDEFSVGVQEDVQEDVQDEAICGCPRRESPRREPVGVQEENYGCPRREQEEKCGCPRRDSQEEPSVGVQEEKKRLPRRICGCPRRENYWLELSASASSMAASISSMSPLRKPMCTSFTSPSAPTR